MSECQVVRGGAGRYAGKQGLEYGEHHAAAHAGDYVYVPAGVPHVPANLGSDVAVALIARTDPREQESVELRPELDALAQLPTL
jgi:mannose-6-phosphate isomerase-like protein (cupin superfamily)